MMCPELYAEWSLPLPYLDGRYGKILNDLGGNTTGKLFIYRSGII